MPDLSYVENTRYDQEKGEKETLVVLYADFSTALSWNVAKGTTKEKLFDREYALQSFSVPL